jgi:hypothetical protein
MAVEKVIKIVAKTDDAVKNVDKLNTEIQATDEATVAAESGFIALTGAINAAGLAFKALGVGLIVSAFVKFKEILGQNQVVMDTINTISTATSEIFLRLTDTIIDFGKKVVNAFRAPGKTIMNFNKLIKDRVNKTIMDTIKGLGLMGKAIAKVFKGEFKEAAVIAKEGAKTLFNANPIVQATNAAKDYAESIFEVGKNIAEQSKQAFNNAKEITELTNKVKLAEAEQRKIQLTYQKDAELQRQLRDDTSASIDDRIAANEKLGMVLEEQFEKEKALVLEKIRLRQLEIAQNQENVDLQVALINAEADLADLEERITGQRSENLTNTNSLIQEQIDKETDLYGGEAREKMIQAIEQFGFDVTEIRQNTANKSGEWTNQALKDFLDAENIKVNVAKTTAQARENAAKGLLGSLGKLAGEGTKMAKTTALAQILIDTAKGVSGAIAAGAGIPFPGNLAAIATGVTSVMAGIANAKKLFSKAGGGGGGIDTSAPSDTSGSNVGFTGSLIPNIPELNNQEQEQQPLQAYVVENDISSSQALQSELEAQATL